MEPFMSNTTFHQRPDRDSLLACSKKWTSPRRPSLNKSICGTSTKDVLAVGSVWAVAGSLASTIGTCALKNTSRVLQETQNKEQNPDHNSKLELQQTNRTAYLWAKLRVQLRSWCLGSPEKAHRPVLVGTVELLKRREKIGNVGPLKRPHLMFLRARLSQQYKNSNHLLQRNRAPTDSCC